jgi:hypothetical protein
MVYSLRKALIKMYDDCEIIFIVEESPEGGYEARSLRHSIFTEADTYEELKKWCRMRSPAILKLINDPA